MEGPFMPPLYEAHAPLNETAGGVCYMRMHSGREEKRVEGYGKGATTGGTREGRGRHRG